MMWLLPSRFTIILSLLLLFFSLLAPLERARAVPPGVNGDKVGPELAFFDAGNQRDVNANVLVPNNFTGAVSVINMVGDNPHHPAPGTDAILRLAEFGPTTDPQVLRDYATKLNGSNLFPTGTIVVVGNELNNLTIEYKLAGAQKNNAGDLRRAAELYAAQFNAFASTIDHSKFRVAPAPPDLYNGDWDPVPWVDRFIQLVNCGGVDTLVANVFDVPTRVGLPNLESYKYLNGKICGKTVERFGGWGSQPDEPLDVQVDFLDNTVLPPEIKGASTLIVDNCNGKRGNQTRTGWMYYVRGKVYTKDGALVDPKTCATSSRSAYIYPGIDDQQGADAKRQMASRYTLTCGSQIKLTTAIENEGDIERPSSAPNPAQGIWQYYQSANLSCPDDPGCLLRGLVGTLTIDHTSTTIPLFRLENAAVPNVSDITRRTNDLEGYFNTPHISEEPLDQAIGNGVVQKRLGQPQLCLDKLQYLRSIQQLCQIESTPTPINNIPLPSMSPVVGARCALDLSIPGTGYTYLQLLSSIPSDFTCTDPGSASDDILKALNSMETTTPKGFKPAYIVTYLDLPEQDPAEASLTKIRNWFAPAGNTRLEKIKNRIKIIKVYVPAGFAESTNSESGFPTYNGGFIQSIRTNLDQSRIEAIELTKKRTIAQTLDQSSQPSMAAPNSNDTNYINCPECALPDKDNLESILVRRINAEQFRNRLDFDENLTCEDDNWAGETSQTVAQSLNPFGNPDPITPSSASARTTARLKGSRDPKDEVRVRTYFLLPEEYRNIQLYEKDFINSFFTKEQIEGLNYVTSKFDIGSPNKAYKYLQLSPVSPKVESKLVAGPIAGYEINIQPGQYSVTAKTIKGKVTTDESANISPVVPGGKLARGIWDIVCNVGRPYDGYKTASYEGLGNLFSKGLAACKGDREESPESTKNTALSGYFNQLKNILTVARRAPTTSTCNAAYVPQAEAQASITKLKSLLPTQTDLWSRYYAGYMPEYDQRLFGQCGGTNCYTFILNTIQNTPVCDSGHRINPYLAIAIALNETGGLKEKSVQEGNNHFGCNIAAFTAYKDGGNATAPNGLACTAKLTSGQLAINPLLGPPLSTENANACVDPTALPTPVLMNSVEDGLACLVGRLNGMCQQGTTDLQALIGYGYNDEAERNQIYELMSLLEATQDYAETCR